MHHSRTIVIVSACLALILLTSALTLAVVSGGQNVQTVQSAQNGQNVSYRAGSATRRLSGSNTVTRQVAAGIVSASATAVFPVTFTESGLPSGSTWNVTLNGVTESGSAGDNSKSESACEHYECQTCRYYDNSPRLMHAFSVCTMLESSDWLYIKAEHRNTQSPQLSQWN